MSARETTVGTGTPAHGSSAVGASRSVPADRLALATFSALLVLTAAFGREFSKLSLGVSWLHPTEIALVVVAVLAVVHLGPRAAFSRIRATGVLIPLVVLWTFGAIAALRGLNEWGFSLVLHDIGLVEYSLIVPIVALLIGSREQLHWLLWALVLSGLVAIVVQAAGYWTPLQWDIAGRLGLVSVASGMYISIFVSWVISRRAAGVEVAWWQYSVAILGVAMVVIGVARAAWLGLLAAFVVALFFVAPGRRLVASAAILAVLVGGAIVSIPGERIVFGENPTPTTISGGGDGSTGEGGGTGGESGAAPSVVGEVTASFDISSVGGQGANSQWRLAYWQYMLEESVRNPVGVGFGTPSAFTWSGVSYDRRTGDPNDPFDVTAPHNSFVNVLYRTGFIGFLALAALVGIAVWRLVAFAREAEAEARATAVWLIGLIGITGGVASLSVALEGPFLGIFFWTALTLGLIAPRLLSTAESGPAASAAG